MKNFCKLDRCKVVLVGLGSNWSCAVVFDYGKFVTSVVIVSAASTTQDLLAGTGYGARSTTTGCQGKQSCWSPHEHSQCALGRSR